MRTMRTQELLLLPVTRSTRYLPLVGFTIERHELGARVRDAVVGHSPFDGIIVGARGERLLRRMGRRLLRLQLPFALLPPCLTLPPLPGSPGLLGLAPARLLGLHLLDRGTVVALRRLLRRSRRGSPPRRSSSSTTSSSSGAAGGRKASAQQPPLEPNPGHRRVDPQTGILYVDPAEEQRDAQAAAEAEQTKPPAAARKRPRDDGEAQAPPPPAGETRAPVKYDADDDGLFD